MLSKPKILAIIPARGGSKGIKDKNIVMLGGKPLIAWTIEEAKKSKLIDRIIVSTDSESIAEVARKFGAEVPFMRPPELARDDTPGMSPVFHALEMVPGYDIIVLLQPTSPMRAAASIDACLDKILGSKLFKFCVSVVESDKHPAWMYKLENSGRMMPILPELANTPRRQDLPSVYALNGAVYAAWIEDLLREKSFITRDTCAISMSRAESTDIDGLEDLHFCEYVLNTRGAL